ncbi:MAG: hypothetical protein RR562_10790 [Longicatena sp.]
MEQLTKDDVEEPVWNLASKYLEKIENLPRMLSEIHYVDDLGSLINRIDFLEDFDSEIEIQTITQENTHNIVTFTINSILSAWCKKSQLLRITVTAKGTCNLKSMGDVELVDIQYENVECDDTRAI